jgi:hypothetical protein
LASIPSGIGPLLLWQCFSLSFFPLLSIKFYQKKKREREREKRKRKRKKEEERRRRKRKRKRRSSYSLPVAYITRYAKRNLLRQKEK